MILDAIRTQHAPHATPGQHYTAPRSGRRHADRPRSVIKPGSDSGRQTAYQRVASKLPILAAARNEHQEL